MRKLLLSIVALAALATAPLCAQAQTISRSQTGAVGTVVTCTYPDASTGKCVLPMVTPATTAGVTSQGLSAGADGDSNTKAGLYTYSRGQIYNGSLWSSVRSPDGVLSGAATGVPSAAIVPQNNSGVAIVPVVSSAAESSRVGLAGVGNLYRISVTTAGSAGYLMVFNATSAPADGAVTPTLCRVVAASSTLSVDMGPIPKRFSTGISAVFSTTGCFTKTASATAYFEIDVR